VSKNKLKEVVMATERIKEKKKEKKRLT